MVKPENNIEKISDEAAAWDARLRAPDCTEGEREAYRAWRADNPANAEAFENLQKILSGMQAQERAPEICSMRDAALNEARAAARRRYLRWGAGLAAGFVLMTGAAGIFLLEPGKNNRAHEASAITAMDAPPYYATVVGERSTITLEDGTIATLNTDTRLRVDYRDSERLVTLFQGQALFDVAKNPDRPFVVAAGDQRIKAIGTIFDVRYDVDKVQVTMLEGVVEVASDERDARGPEAPVKQKAAPITLRMGQQLLANAASSQAVVREANVERATIWREGRVFFEDSPLTEAIQEMNRYSATQIIAADPALAGFRVNGMFRTGQQASFVNAVTTYFPIDADQTSDDRIVLNLAQQE